MRASLFSGTAVRHIGACFLVLALVLAGCASRPLVMADPPPPELRQRMDRVVLRVYSDAEPTTYSTDEVLVDANAGAGYAAKNVATAGAKTGLVVFRIGCDPHWGIFWPVTCAAGAAGGAAVGVGTAVVGGAAGAAYGASQARSQEQVDTANASLDRFLAEARLTDALRGHLVSAVSQRKAATIIDDQRLGAPKQRQLDNHSALIIVAVKFDSFRIRREGRLTPELSLDTTLSASLYDAPEAGRRYTRSWSFSTQLGSYYTLTDEGGAGLRRATDDALRTLASAVVEDIFFNAEPVPVRRGKSADGQVVTTYGRESVATTKWFSEQKRKAACGEAEAQLALGKEYAEIDPRVYGATAQAVAVEGYVWLRRAGAPIRGGTNAANLFSELTKRLSPDEIAEGERLAAEPQSSDCGANSPRFDVGPAKTTL